MAHSSTLGRTPSELLDSATLYELPKWLAAASTRASKAIAAMCSAGGLQDSLARLMVPSRLPWKPGCASNKDSFRQQSLLHFAIQEPYIELNSPAGIDWLVFDIDEANGGSCADVWRDADLPAPNIVILNPVNGHAQLIYSLETRVCTGDSARQAPQRWLNDLRTEFGARLHADLAFANCRSKNPLHSSWQTTVLREASYSLGELAEYARPDELKAARKARGRAREVRELGRNIEVFDRLRFWAYQAKRNFVDATFAAFHSACTSQAEKFNTQFDRPLLISEVGCIIKSISRWVWNRYGGQVNSAAELSALQADLGARKGLKARNVGIPLIEDGASIKGIMEATGVSRSTAYRWRANTKAALAEAKIEENDEDGEDLDSVLKPSGLSPNGVEEAKLQELMVEAQGAKEASTPSIEPRTPSNSSFDSPDFCDLAELQLMAAIALADGLSRCTPLRADLPHAARIGKWSIQHCQVRFDILDTGLLWHEPSTGEGGAGMLRRQTG